MSNVTETLTALALGISHAAIFSVFLTAAAGKLSACRPGLGSMCVKGVTDAALALMCAMLMVPEAAQTAGAAALVIGSGGWLREKFSRNTVCNCFGVLTSLFHPWRNASRVILIVCGVAILMLPTPADGYALWNGAAVGFAVIMASAAVALARSPLQRNPTRIDVRQNILLQADRIPPDIIVGSDGDGRPFTLRELTAAGPPLTLLLTAPGCEKCESLKSELAPYTHRLPLRIVEVLQRAPAPPSQLTPTQLLGSQHFRKAVAVTAFPALIVCEGSSANADFPIALGPDAIKGELLRMILDDVSRSPQDARPLAAQPENMVAELI